MKKLKGNKWNKVIIRFLNVIILLALVYMPIQSDSYKREANQFTFYNTDWIGVIEKYSKEYKIYLDDVIIEL